MVDNFAVFAKLVLKDFQAIAKNPEVFVVDVDGDKLYEQYLKAFPNGTDPKISICTEHDCSCCKNFIRRIGSVVAIDTNNELKTVWDSSANDAPHPYAVVAASLQASVLSANISKLFRVATKEISFGTELTRAINKGTGRVITWSHFYTKEIPNHLRVASPGQVCGDYATTVQVFKRGLIELVPSAVEIVASLIESNNLYRGEEHKKSVVQFQKAQKDYLAQTTDRERDIFAWKEAHGPASRFRNTVIGTLVQDLSDGQDVDKAVRSFEAKVAPQNYKRTTAIITPGMVKKAMETIETLGLEPALERRFAVIGDISVNDVKWVDGSAKNLMKGGLGDILMQHAVSTAASVAEKAEPISMDDFINRILPETTGLEVLVKGEHLGNLMSLTAPVHPEPKQLFRWTNDFAWSYRGNVADSIKERVKKAGGSVDGVMRVSLSWFNFDDLDLHIHEPKSRGAQSAGSDHIWFREKTGWTGGRLDVDMNAGGINSREPVENVIWSSTVSDGDYKVVVNNYYKRETNDVGFIVEIENNGKISHFSYNKAVCNSQDIHVATLKVKNNVIVSVEPGNPGITSSSISKTVWGLTTEKFVKVNAVTFSPNYWGDNAVGNKHTFFLLDGAKNDEATRGFYNEYLHPRLESHRKVFEIIADKTKCVPTDSQLSGIGFSSTKHDQVTVKVRQGKKQRLFTVQIKGE